MSGKDSKEIRVKLRGENVHKFTELKGKLQAETNEELVNKMVSELCEREWGKEREK
ncbi:MAG: hypothetical protein ACLFVL_00395 [Candidatus Aenigmatarchaeota archaeon]